jgi:IS605 OrfB family transposase
MLASMKLIANLKLNPTPTQAHALSETLKTTNAACNWLSAHTWATKIFGQFALHPRTYAACRTQFALSAQMAVRCIAKVADAYKLDRKTRRHLRQLKGRRARFQKDTNHRIAKQIVQTAQRSSATVSAEGALRPSAAAIALEDLRGIRQRIKARRSQRARQSNWGFSQLRHLIGYKAHRTGIPVLLVDPRHTSQTCPCCGHVSRPTGKARPSSPVSHAGTLHPLITSRLGTSEPGQLSTCLR